MGGGLYNTKELQTMKYDKGVHIDQKGWMEAVKKEHNWMVKNNV